MAKFRVGDLVTIREWDDMAQEYGLDEKGDIKMFHTGFPASAKWLCGKVAYISDLSDGLLLSFVEPVKFPWIYFYEEMLEPLSAKDRADVEIGGYAKVITRGTLFEGWFVFIDERGYDYNNVHGTVVFPPEGKGQQGYFNDVDLEPVTNPDCLKWLNLFKDGPTDTGWTLDKVKAEREQYQEYLRRVSTENPELLGQPYELYKSYLEEVNEKKEKKEDDNGKI